MRSHNFATFFLLSGMSWRLCLNWNLGSLMLQVFPLRTWDFPHLLWLCLWPLSLPQACVMGIHMPQCLRNSVLTPTPKSNTDPSSSQSYCPIALSSSLLRDWSSPGMRTFFIATHCSMALTLATLYTTLCSGVVKNIISRYIHNGSAVLGCFLDASKAFDSVDHAFLFQILLDRGLPYPIVWFLLSWYTQCTQVCWDSCLSEPFCVSNGLLHWGWLKLLWTTFFTNYGNYQAIHILQLFTVCHMLKLSAIYYTSASVLCCLVLLHLLQPLV